MSTETKESLEAELAAIVKWEREQKDLWFWEKLGRLPFVLLDRITPKFVHDKVGQAINELGSFIQTEAGISCPNGRWLPYCRRKRSVRSSSIRSRSCR